jgi:hypothetical protein
MADTNKIEQAFLKAHGEALDQITSTFLALFKIPEEDQFSLFITSCLGNVIAHCCLRMDRKLLGNVIENPYIDKDYQDMVASTMQEISDLMIKRLEEKLPTLNRKIDLN